MILALSTSLSRCKVRMSDILRLLADSFAASLSLACSSATSPSTPASSNAAPRRASRPTLSFSAQPLPPRRLRISSFFLSLARTWPAARNLRPSTVSLACSALPSLASSGSASLSCGYLDGQRARNHSLTGHPHSFVLFLVFFRYNSVDDPETEEADEDQPRWQTALLVASLTLLHGLAVIVITGVLSTVARDSLSTWANVLGIMAALLAAVQYVPQIWTTYHLKHVGSLSIPMMCIQTPGGFVFAASLFARLGLAGWSSWGIFVLTATMQGILLYLAIYYEIQAHKNGSETPKSPSPILGRSHLHANGFEDTSSDRQTDTTPLLRAGGTGDSERNYDTNRG